MLPCAASLNFGMSNCGSLRTTTVTCQAQTAGWPDTSSLPCMCSCSQTRLSPRLPQTWTMCGSTTTTCSCCPHCCENVSTGSAAASSSIPPSPHQKSSRTFPKRGEILRSLLNVDLIGVSPLTFESRLCLAYPTDGHIGCCQLVHDESALLPLLMLILCAVWASPPFLHSFPKNFGRLTSGSCGFQAG